MIKEIITTILVGIASIFGISDNKIHNLGAFSDPFLSIQLAESPSNDYCLKTNGTDNLWSSSCGTGGSGAGWASTTADINSIYFTGDGIGKVGIGTSSAFAVLAVNPTAGQASNQFVIGSSTGTSLIVKNNGFIGIGSTSPNTKLVVNDSTAASTNGTHLLSLGASYGGGTDGSGGYLTFRNQSSDVEISRIRSAINTTDGAYGLRFINLGVQGMVVNSAGKVGIGTTSPLGVLSVTNVGTSPSFIVEDSTSPDTSPFIIDANGNVGIGTTTPMGKFNITDAIVQTASTSGIQDVLVVQNSNSLPRAEIQYDNSQVKLKFNYPVTNTDLFVMQMNTNLTGIGTTTPYSAFSVTNTQANPSFVVEDSTSPDTTPFIIDANGNVGIGTTSPTKTLDIVGSLRTNTPTSPYKSIILSSLPNTPDFGAALYMSTTKGNGVDQTGIRMRSTYGGVGTNGYPNFAIDRASDTQSYGNDNSTLTYVNSFTIDGSNGNVGIGTTTPFAKFSVVGDQVLSDSSPQILFNDTDTTNAELGIRGDGGFGYIGRFNEDQAISNGNITLDLSNNRVGFSDLTPDFAAEFVGTSGSGYLGITNSVDGDILTVNSSGNFGIGTTTPGQRLSVAGDILGNNIIGSYFTATSTSVASIFPYASTTAISAGTICFTSDTCRTSWPTGGSGAFPFTPTTFGATNANSTSTLIGFTAGIYSLASSTIGNGTQTTGLTISGGATTTGNAYFASSVGMGTQSPSNKLHIFTSTNSEDGIMIENSNSGTTAASSFYLKNDSSVVGGATIFSSGYNLTHLRNRATFLSQNGITLITDSNVSSGGSNNIQFLTGGYNSSNERMRLTSGGLLGIATTSPWRTLSVAGTVSFNGLTSSATGNAVCITTGKDITDAGGGTCTPSSIRFKENIEKLPSGFAIGQLGKLEIVSFDYKNKDPHETNHSYGMIAEEVEKIDNNLVDYGYDGKPLTLHFEKITGLLVQAVQEILTSIKSITNRQDNLEKIITEQQKQIDVLQRELSAIKVNK